MFPTHSTTARGDLDHVQSQEKEGSSVEGRRCDGLIEVSYSISFVAFGTRLFPRDM